MNTPTRVLSIHPTWRTANRHAINHPEHLGVWVEFGVKGTTPTRPWAVVAPAKKRVAS